MASRARARLLPRKSETAAWLRGHIPRQDEGLARNKAATVRRMIFTTHRQKLRDRFPRAGVEGHGKTDSTAAVRAYDGRDEEVVRLPFEMGKERQDRAAGWVI